MPVPLLGWAIRRKHSAVDEERGGRVVTRHIYNILNIGMQNTDTLQADPRNLSESAMPCLFKPPK